MVPQQNKQKCRLKEKQNVHDCGIFVHVLYGLYELFEPLYFGEWHFNIIHFSGILFFFLSTYLFASWSFYFLSVFFLFSPSKMGSHVSFPDKVIEVFCLLVSHSFYSLPRSCSNLSGRDFSLWVRTHRKHSFSIFCSFSFFLMSLQTFTFSCQARSLLIGDFTWLRSRTK